MTTSQACQIVWTQAILARALHRQIRDQADRLAAEGDDSQPLTFRYADTHAGPGLVSALDPHLLGRVGSAGLTGFAPYFRALEAGPVHPGSWVLAHRVASLFDRPKVEMEIDANDIDPAVMERAKGNREGGWTRFWSHDWFLFLRSLLALARRMDFVFIDPPPDDPRGPAYAIDAAIMLDTMAVPYMITYPAVDPQEPIDLIGRPGLELRLAEDATGVVLGGGAEVVLLDALPELVRLAETMGGEFAARLPREMDYSI